MLKRIFLLSILFCTALILTANAQESEPEEESPRISRARLNQRSLGDQSFSIAIGFNIPLFTVLLNDWPGTSNQAGIYPTHMNLGGISYLSYGVYLSPIWKIGAQLGGSFVQDINENFVYLVPLMIKGTLELHPGRRISVPIFLGFGISFNSWKLNNFMVDMVFRPGAGFYFDWSYEWSFGLEVSYLFIPQFGLGANKYEESIGNFLDVTLTAEYHF